MATRAQLEAALFAADQAGNEEDARALAAALRGMPSDGPAKSVSEPAKAPSAIISPDAEGGAFEAIMKGQGLAPAANAIRYGGAMLQPEGGPGGAAAAGGSEKLAQLFEGSNDPRAVGQATAMGAIPFGRLAGAGKVLGKVAVPASAAGTNYAVNQAADAAYGPEKGGNNEQQAAIVGAITAISPALGAIAGRIMGNVAPEEAARVAAAKLNNANKDAVLAKMQAQGARVVPSSVNPSIKNKILESVAGIQNVEAGIARENQPLFNAIGRQEAGIAADAPINAQTLDAARAAIGKDSYAAARNSGIGDLLDQWRSAATKLKEAEAKMAGGSYTVERGAAVDAAQSAMDRASEALDAASAGNPELLAQLNAAKKAFGKNYDVESAVLSGTDEVRPAVLSQMLANRGEGGLSGGLRDIAQFHNAFDRSTKNPAKMATAPGAASAGTGLIAGGGNPAAAAALVGGIPVVRGAIRDLLTSPGYQAKNAVRNYTPATSSDPKIEAILNRIAALVAANQ